jgi:Uma2 family endonuclease
MVPPLLEEQFAGLSDVGIRVERVAGLTVWEAQPVWVHQAAVDRIRSTIHASVEGGGCGCVHAADVTIAFADGSEKRPDISIFCRVPDEQDTAITLLPEAVVEVISKGYEAKDYEVGIPFYLSVGVKDVVAFDPRSGQVRHYRRDGVAYHDSPVEIGLECGCTCTV